MLGSPTLEVLIGLMFIYFVFSVICSALIESVASVFALRARALHDAIESLLDGADTSVKEFLANPVIAPLAGKCRKSRTSESWWKNFKDWLAGQGAGVPQYIPPDKFATALIDTISKKHSNASTRGRHPFTSLVAASNKAPITDDPLHKVVQTFVNRANTEVPLPSATADNDRLQHVREQFETWYQDTMDRATGWYKRRTQTVLFWVAVPLVIALNVDTISLAQRLYADKDTRLALAGAATQATTQPTATQATALKAEDDQNALHQRVSEIDRLSLPLGWSTVNVPPFTDNLHGKGHWPFLAFGLEKFLGLLLTVFALSLGSSFWFDMLSKLVNLRSAGVKPDSANDPDAPASATPKTAGNTTINIMPTTTPPSLIPDDYWNRTTRNDDWTSFTADTLVPKGAAALARAALLAYEDTAFVSSVLSKQWTLPAVASPQTVRTYKSFLSAGGTQAYVAAWDDFIIVAFRGTQGDELADLLDDACCKPISRPDLGPGQVAIGFSSSLNERLDELDTYLTELLKAKPRPVHVTGHSLGAALATLYAAHLSIGDLTQSPIKDLPRPTVTLVNFGSPRVGDSTFAKALEAALNFSRDAWLAAPSLDTLKTSRLLRFVDHNDVVTRVPPRDSAFDHAGPTLYLKEDGSLDVTMTEWRRYLNSVVDAFSQFKALASSSLKDHSMEKYLMILANLANDRQ